jgi:FAD:protein FMN transferase
VSEIGSASFPALGTTAVVLVTEHAALAPARELVEREVATIDAAASRFRPDSELTGVNRAQGGTVRVSALFAEAIAAALRAAALTEGDVDPTIGRALRAVGYDRDYADVRAGASRALRVRATASSGWRTVELDSEARTVRVPAGVELDLGATAKALAADRAADAAQSAVGGGVLVSLGGDIATAGPAPPGGWPVRVADDSSAGAAPPGQTVTVASGGLATSSTATRRWFTASGPRHHIVDPRTGDSAEPHWRTASVAAGSCLDANIAATAAIVRGAAAPEWLGRLHLPARLVTSGGETVRVGGWPPGDER